MGKKKKKKKKEEDEEKDEDTEHYIDLLQMAYIQVTFNIYCLHHRKHTASLLQRPK